MIQWLCVCLHYAIMTIKGFLIVAFFIIGMGMHAKENAYRHSLRLGLNAALFTTWDMVGLGNYGEYAYSFHPKLALVPRIMSANATSRNSLGTEQTTQFGASLSARLTPFPEGYKGLKLDVGALYQRISSTRVNYGNPQGNLAGTGNAFRSSREDLFGIIGSLSLGILEGGRLGTGLRCEMLTSFQQGTWHNEMLQAGIYMAVKF